MTNMAKGDKSLNFGIRKKKKMNQEITFQKK